MFGQTNCMKKTIIDPPDVHELFAVTTGWKQATGSNDSAMGALDYSGPHFADYASHASSRITITADCILDITISTKSCNSTRGNNNFQLKLVRNGSTTTIATATDNNASTRTLNLGPREFYAGDVLYGTEYNGGSQYTARIFTAYIINP